MDCDDVMVIDPIDGFEALLSKVSEHHAKNDPEHNFLAHSVHG